MAPAGRPPPARCSATSSTPRSTSSQGTHGSLGTFGQAGILPIDETSAEYLLSLDVADQPGVLHAVTGVFARHDVSIRAAEQEGNAPDARLVFITHEAKESAVQATVRELRELDVVRRSAACCG